MLSSWRRRLVAVVFAVGGVLEEDGLGGEGEE